MASNYNTNFLNLGLFCSGFQYGCLMYRGIVLLHKPPKGSFNNCSRTSIALSSSPKYVCTTASPSIGTTPNKASLLSGIN